MFILALALMSTEWQEPKPLRATMVFATATKLVGVDYGTGRYTIIDGDGSLVRSVTIPKSTWHVGAIGDRLIEGGYRSGVDLSLDEPVVRSMEPPIVTHVKEGFTFIRHRNSVAVLFREATGVLEFNVGRYDGFDADTTTKSVVLLRRGSKTTLEVFDAFTKELRSRVSLEAPPGWVVEPDRTDSSLSVSNQGRAAYFVARNNWPSPEEAVVVSDLKTGELIFWHNFLRVRDLSEMWSMPLHRVAIHANGHWVATAFDGQMRLFRVESPAEGS